MQTKIIELHSNKVLDLIQKIKSSILVSPEQRMLRAAARYGQNMRGNMSPSEYQAVLKVFKKQATAAISQMPTADTAQIIRSLLKNIPDITILSAQWRLLMAAALIEILPTSEQSPLWISFYEALKKITFKYSYYTAFEFTILQPEIFGLLKLECGRSLPNELHQNFMKILSYIPKNIVPDSERKALSQWSSVNALPHLFLLLEFQDKPSFVASVVDRFLSINDPVESFDIVKFALQSYDATNKRALIDALSAINPKLADRFSDLDRHIDNSDPYGKLEEHLRGSYPRSNGPEVNLTKELTAQLIAHARSISPREN